jgi:RimJ/RimL family protein N-acetyltransferase
MMNRQPTLPGTLIDLRPLAEADWNGLFAVASDKELWAQHPMHDRWQEPVFRAFFADALAHGGALVAVERATGAIIGSSQYRGLTDENGGSVEIGWSLIARSHWGGRYNGEMKRLMIAHALASVAQVTFRIGENNWRSRRAVEKIEGVLTDAIDVVPGPDGPAVHVTYAITREAFANGPLNL